VGIISQPENRSVEESDQPDGILSKNLIDRRAQALRPYSNGFCHNVGANCVRPKGTLSKRKSLICSGIEEKIAIKREF